MAGVDAGGSGITYLGKRHPIFYHDESMPLGKTDFQLAQNAPSDTLKSKSDLYISGSFIKISPLGSCICWTLDSWIHLDSWVRSNLVSKTLIRSHPLILDGQWIQSDLMNPKNPPIENAGQLSTGVWGQ